MQYMIEIESDISNLIYVLEESHLHHVSISKTSLLDN